MTDDDIREGINSISFHPHMPIVAFISQTTVLNKNSNKTERSASNIKIYNIAQKSYMAHLACLGTYNNLRFSEEGNFLAASAYLPPGMGDSDDEATHKISIWSVEDNFMFLKSDVTSKKKNVYIHQKPITCMAFCPAVHRTTHDGNPVSSLSRCRYLASGSEDGIIRIWEFFKDETYHQLMASKKVQPVTQISFSSDGLMLMALQSPGYIYGFSINHTNPAEVNVNAKMRKRWFAQLDKANLLNSSEEQDSSPPPEEEKEKPPEPEKVLTKKQRKAKNATAKQLEFVLGSLSEWHNKSAQKMHLFMKISDKDHQLPFLNCLDIFPLEKTKEVDQTIDLAEESEINPEILAKGPDDHMKHFDGIKKKKVGMKLWGSLKKNLKAKKVEDEVKQRKEDEANGVHHTKVKGNIQKMIKCVPLKLNSNSVMQSTTGKQQEYYVVVAGVSIIAILLVRMNFDYFNFGLSNTETTMNIERYGNYSWLIQSPSSEETHFSCISCSDDGGFMATGQTVHRNKGFKAHTVTMWSVSDTSLSPMHIGAHESDIRAIALPTVRFAEALQEMGVLDENHSYIGTASLDETLRLWTWNTSQGQGASLDETGEEESNANEALEYDEKSAMKSAMTIERPIPKHRLNTEIYNTIPDNSAVPKGEPKMSGKPKSKAKVKAEKLAKVKAAKAAKAAKGSSSKDAVKVSSPSSTQVDSTDKIESGFHLANFERVVGSAVKIEDLPPIPKRRSRREIKAPPKHLTEEVDPISSRQCSIGGILF